MIDLKFKKKLKKIIEAKNFGMQYTFNISEGTQQ